MSSRHCALNSKWYSALRTLLSTLCSTLCTVHSALRTLLYSLLSTLCTPHSALCPLSLRIDPHCLACPITVSICTRMAQHCISTHPNCCVHDLCTSQLPHAHTQSLRRGGATASASGAVLDEFLGQGFRSRPRSLGDSSVMDLVLSSVGSR